MLPIYCFVAGFYLILISYQLFAIISVLYAIRRYSRTLYHSLTIRDPQKKLRVIKTIIQRRGRLYSEKSPIYIISTSNLITDFVMLSLHLIYFVPSLFFQTYFFSKGIDDQVVIFFSSIFMVLWYQSTLSQVLMAINRVTVMCFSRFSVFTRKGTLFFTIGIYPIALTLAVFSQYIFPCCRLTFDYNVYSYRYVEKAGILNYPNTYFDLPLNTTSTIVCVVCYSWIVRWLYVFNSKISTECSQKKRNMEIKYAKQFFFISVFYMNGWTSFRYLPVLIGNNNLYLYSFCSLNALLCFGANGLVYYHTNSEVRAILRKDPRSSDAQSSSHGLNIYSQEIPKQQENSKKQSGESSIKF